MGVPQKWMVYNGWFNHQWLNLGVENAWKITKKRPWVSEMVEEN